MRITQKKLLRIIDEEIRQTLCEVLVPDEVMHPYWVQTFETLSEGLFDVEYVTRRLSYSGILEIGWPQSTLTPTPRSMRQAKERWVKSVKQGGGRPPYKSRVKHHARELIMHHDEWSARWEKMQAAKQKPFLGSSAQAGRIDLETKMSEMQRNFTLYREKRLAGWGLGRAWRAAKADWIRGIEGLRRHYRGRLSIAPETGPKGALALKDETPEQAGKKLQVAIDDANKAVKQSKKSRALRAKGGSWAQRVGKKLGLMGIAVSAIQAEDMMNCTEGDYGCLFSALGVDLPEETDFPDSVLQSMEKRRYERDEFWDCSRCNELARLGKLPKGGCTCERRR